MRTITSLCFRTLFVVVLMMSFIVTFHVAAATVFQTLNMAGNAITNLGEPSNPDHAATRGYVDALSNASGAAYVKKSGDTMAGFLTLDANPQSNMQAATKHYVDNCFKGFDYDARYVYIDKYYDGTNGYQGTLQAPYTNFFHALTQLGSNAFYGHSTPVVYHLGHGFYSYPKYNDPGYPGISLRIGIVGRGAFYKNIHSDLSGYSTAFTEFGTFVDNIQHAWPSGCNTNNAILYLKDVVVSGAYLLSSAHDDIYCDNVVFLSTTNNGQQNYHGLYYTGRLMGWDSTNANIAVVDSSSLRPGYMASIQASNDATYIKKSGDTMTGLLTLSGAPTTANHAATRGYVDALSNASGAAYVKKSGDTMTGLLTTPSNCVQGAIAIGTGVTIPNGVGAHNAGYNDGTMSANGSGAQNAGFNKEVSTMTANDNGAQNIGENSGTMIANGRGAMNIGNNDSSTMHAEGCGSQNAGNNNDGATMYVAGHGAMNRGDLDAGRYSTNSGNGSVALLDNSGNMLVTNHAALVLGNGYSMGDRTLVADAVIIRAMGARPTDAATKGYVDAAAANFSTTGDWHVGTAGASRNIIMENDGSMITTRRGTGNSIRLKADNASGGQIVLHSPLSMPGAAGQVTGVTTTSNGYTVPNAYCRSTSIVLITPTSSMTCAYWVTAANGSFTVRSTTTSNWSFNYFIVNP